MSKTASLIVAVATVGTILWADGSAAATATPNDAEQTTELSAQRRQRPPRTRIRIYAPYAYPGPHAVRHCISWLAPEWRPSGTVIVPQMRCRWVRG